MRLPFMRLFELLFVRDMDLDIARAEDFYREIGNEKKAENFGAQIGVEGERAKAIFFDLFLYSHGIAVLTAAGKVVLEREECERMLSHVLDALIAAVRDNSYLIDFYSHYDEEGRLASRHGSVEFLMTMRYIENYLEPGSRIYLDYHFAVCEREDLLGITSHGLDIF